MKNAVALIENNSLFILFLAGSACYIYFSNDFSILHIHFCSILFHALISFLVFVVAWNSRRLADNSFLSFMGTAFLFIGLIDISHLLCLKWFQTFKEAISAGSLLPLQFMSDEEADMVNCAAQLWIAARYLETVSFALSFLYLRRKVNFLIYFTGFAGITALLMFSIFVWGAFPVCFNRIEGFTGFKTGNHFLIALFFLGMVYLLFRHERYFEKKMLYLLGAVLVFASLSELCFLNGVMYFSYSRPVGHLLKCISIYLIYKAIITTGFTSPLETLFRDLKRSELTLARERDKLFSILDLLPGFIYIQSETNAIGYANRRFTDIFGQIDGRSCREIFLNCHGACAECPADQVLKTRKSQSFEREHVDNRTYFIHQGFFLDSDGSPKVLAIGTDITDRVSAQAALEESKEGYRTLYERTPVMLHSLDRNGHILNVSDHWLKMMGYEKEEVVGRKFIDYLTPDSRRNIMEIGMPALHQNGYCQDLHYQLVKKSGEVIDIELSVYSEKDIAGEMNRSLAVSIDVTEKLKGKKELERRVDERTNELREKTRALEMEIRDRIATEEAMRAAESKYSLLVENSLTGIYIKQHGKIIFANNKFCEIHGYEHHDIIGMDSWKLVYPLDRALVDAYSKRRLEGDAAPDAYESRRLTRNGNLIWVSSNNTRIIYRDHPAILGNLVDITLRKKMEEELIRSEKELKLLSARLLNAQESERKRIALELHDTIAQNLVSVKFSLGQKLKQMKAPPPDGGIKIEDIIEVVQENISEIRRIMTDLRPSLLDDLGILATISWHCREFQKIYTHIRVDCYIDLDEKDVPEELKIVLFRILQEAMNNTAKHSHADKIQLTLRSLESMLELIIEDNGDGFDFPQVLSRINSNTGLGLVGMRERTEQSFGSFLITSRKHKGTRICARWRIGADGGLIALKYPNQEIDSERLVL